MSLSHLKSVKKIRLKVDGTNWTGSAGTTDLNSDVVDSQNFEAVEFTVAFGAIVSGAVTSIKAQQGAQSDGSDAADLADTAITVADTDDNKIFRLEVVRPRERYLRVVTDRGTQNATVDYIEAELFRPREQAITQDSTVGGNESHVSPAEGTA